MPLVTANVVCTLTRYGWPEHNCLALGSLKFHIRLICAGAIARERERDKEEEREKWSLTQEVCECTSSNESRTRRVSNEKEIEIIEMRESLRFSAGSPILKWHFELFPLWRHCWKRIRIISSHILHSFFTKRYRR